MRWDRAKTELVATRRKDLLEALLKHGTMHVKALAAIVDLGHARAMLPLVADKVVIAARLSPTVDRCRLEYTITELGKRELSLLQGTPQDIVKSRTVKFVRYIPPATPTLRANSEVFLSLPSIVCGVPQFTDTSTVNSSNTGHPNEVLDLIVKDQKDSAW